jgi:DNA-binding NarL/FixJ family response regulator
MITNKLKELAALREKAAALEAELHAERSKELAALPTQYGFTNVSEFLAAVQAATGGRRSPRRGRRGRAPSSPATTKRVGRGGRRRRAKITDETRDQVKQLVKEGNTGAEIAKALGISVPSVQNIKKALGLVHARK